MTQMTLTVPSCYRPFVEATLATVVDRIRKEIVTNQVPAFARSEADGLLTVTVTVLPVDLVEAEAVEAAA